MPVWTERIAVLARPSLDARMFAQRGRLITGGLPDASGGKAMTCEGKPVDVDEWPEITTLAFDFPMPTAGPNDAWSGGGWTIRIEKSWKRSIRERLAAWIYPITPATMYPVLDDKVKIAAARDAASLAP